ncbi:HugZ family protein [Methylotenera mobilis]|uniref:Pyridoxamine 5'-phosphate oxidase-related FMN-binding n=1 Tax=Methylotenera mobilis (strain JLW8 / ATCC BAA-1282 / DSM 17540) TaxID=583345 RepID=C6WUQ2_METML|nr:DUF2470 domain-containing protein [Methylotenera mobilis]ACT47651.1 pyridoxamine 5'-phosphate oxidase-related FMN-binding [Methylotenera mobilis JLW8]
MSQLHLEARQFLRSTRTAILSTHSVKFAGFPFGSVAPFVLDHQCQPIILISTIAEHTKNIAANPKVSLLVFAGAEDLQANARLTLLGNAHIIDKNEDTDLRARYLRYLPQASSYFDMHDFAFSRIQIETCRYIAGFGKMGWLSGNDLMTEMPVDNVLAAQEAHILDHMNTDHADSLIAYCRHVHGVEATQASMLGIDCDGFDVAATVNNQSMTLRFVFATPIHDAQSARAALVSLSKASNA